MKIWALAMDADSCCPTTIHTDFYMTEALGKPDLDKHNEKVAEEAREAYNRTMKLTAEEHGANRKGWLEAYPTVESYVASRLKMYGAWLEEIEVKE